MIYGEKTRLRRIERTDIPTFVRWFSDPLVRENLMINRPISTAEEERWFEESLRDENSEIFAIETAQGKHIGNVGLHEIDWRNRRAELGIVIGERDHWDRGYGSDAIRTLLRFAFQDMNLHRVFLRVHQDNLRGIRAYEKCGFQHEGWSREAVFKRGQYYDSLRMSILAHEFANDETVPQPDL